MRIKQVFHASKEVNIIIANFLISPLMSLTAEEDETCYKPIMLPLFSDSYQGFF
jgi:hypothetical protein